MCCTLAWYLCNCTAIFIVVLTYFTEHSTMGQDLGLSRGADVAPLLSLEDDALLFHRGKDDSP
jgi:hypothetical protein